MVLFDSDDILGFLVCDLYYLYPVTSKQLWWQHDDNDTLANDDDDECADDKNK